MKVEAAIKQKKFKNPFVKLEVNILYTASIIENLNTKYFRKFGISPQQFNVLRILRGNYPRTITMVQVSERMIDKSSNATRLLDKLILKAYATKKVNLYNRRQVDIMITQEGLDLLDKIDKEYDILIKKYKNLSEQDAILLNDLLDKLNN